MEIKSCTNGKIMAYTGRCWYCGSEDMEEYSDGSHECKECGMTWGGKQYVQRQVQKPRYRRTFSHSGESKEWEHSMKPYREKWRKREGKSPLTDLTVNKQGVKWYDAEVLVTDGCTVPAFLYFTVAIIIYGFAGLMIYVACSS